MSGGHVENEEGCRLQGGQVALLHSPGQALWRPAGVTQAGSSWKMQEHRQRNPPTPDLQLLKKFTKRPPTSHRVIRQREQSGCSRRRRGKGVLSPDAFINVQTTPPSLPSRPAGTVWGGGGLCQAPNRRIAQPPPCGAGNSVGRQRQLLGFQAALRGTDMLTP